MVNRTQTGYTVILPPGWIRIPARGGSAAAIERLLSLRFEPAQATVREEVRGQLTELITKTGREGALDVFIPVVDSHALGGGVSFVVSLASLDPAGRADRTLLAINPGESDQVTPALVDGSRGLRRERMSALSTQPGTSASRVDYFLPVPRQPGRWIVVAMSAVHITTPEGPSRHLVDLFDSIMTTFRWGRPVADVS